MQTKNDTSKPETELKEETGDGCSGAPCSASWLPIKTAPNSLNVILVTDGEAIWVDQKLGELGDDIEGPYCFNGHEDWEEVTHWMPIPSLPNVKHIRDDE
jgi:hypothetical protein